MTTGELKKILLDSGCRRIREGDRHEVWYSPISGKKFTIGRHKKEVPTGTKEKILKQAGLK